MLVPENPGSGLADQRSIRAGYRDHLAGRCEQAHRVESAGGVERLLRRPKGVRQAEDHLTAHDRAGKDRVHSHGHLVDGGLAADPA